MADFPSSIHAPVTQVKGGIGLSAFINAETAEIAAVETELGTLPKGNHADVKTRLDQVDLMGLPNILINGGFEIWQREITFSSPASGVYTADRWKMNVVGGPPTFTVTKETTIVDEGGASGKVDVTVVGGATRLFFQQVVEDFVRYRGKTLTVQMRVRANVASRVQIQLSDSTTAPVSVFHSGGGAFETLTATINVDAAASQLLVNIGFATIAPVVGTFYVDSCRFIIGSKPIGFIPPDPAQELARAQRYFEKSYTIGVFPGAVATVGAHSMVLAGSRGDQFIWENSQDFAVAKRAIPTVVLFSTVTGTAARVVIVVTDRASVASLMSHSRFSVINNTGGAIGAANENGFFQWTADAEL